jgi:NADPH:quinone reductase-like Zn-dependent oxidoreductase
VSGEYVAPDGMHALGAPRRDGVLRQRLVLSEHALVAVPPHLSDAQAATLPCAAVTAWRALVTEGKLQVRSALTLALRVVGGAPAPRRLLETPSSP